MSRPPEPSPLGQRREAAVGAVVCTGLFLVLTLVATVARGAITDADRVLGRAPYRFAGQHPQIAWIAERIEWLTAPDHVVLGGLLCALPFLAAGALHRAVFVAYVPLAADLLYPVIKDLVGRPRPAHVDPLHAIGGLSFPSGHATVLGAAAWTAMVLVVALVADPVRRHRLLLAIGTTVLVVALDRLALGVHYFSDVLAGLLLAGAITLAAAAVLDPFRSAVTAFTLDPSWAGGPEPEAAAGR